MEEKFTAICHFCGQVIKGFTLCEQFQTQAEADKYAVEHCDCEEARDNRESLIGEDILAKNTENIENGIELFKRFLTHNKVKNKKEYAPFLKGLAHNCCLGIVHEVSCTVDRIKVKIQLTRKYELEFSFAYTIKQKSIY